MFMKRILILILLLVVQFSCKEEEKAIPITEFSAEKLDNAVLLDVRTPEEYSGGHLEQATNIDFLGDQFEAEVQQISTDKKIYVYCKKGGRSAKAAEKLTALGYTVIDLQGGYDAWVEEKD